MNSLDLPIKARGRPELPIVITVDREICESDIPRAHQRTFVAKPLDELRCIHHAIANAIAHGHTQRQVAIEFGRSESRISVLMSTPSFRSLVEHYRAQMIEGAQLSMREPVEIMNSNLILALDNLHEQLEDHPERFSVGQLMQVIGDHADRLGPAKKQTNVNVNIDLADRLATARRAMEGKSLERLGDHSKLVGGNK